jgi:hypothetical protein
VNLQAIAVNIAPCPQGHPHYDFIVKIGTFAEDGSATDREISYGEIDIEPYDIPVLEQMSWAATFCQLISGIMAEAAGNPDLEVINQTAVQRSDT